MYRIKYKIDLFINRTKYLFMRRFQFASGQTSVYNDQSVFVALLDVGQILKYRNQLSEGYKLDMLAFMSHSDRQFCILYKMVESLAAAKVVCLEPSSTYTTHRLTSPCHPTIIYPRHIFSSLLKLLFIKIKNHYNLPIVCVFNFP